MISLQRFAFSRVSVVRWLVAMALGVCALSLNIAAVRAEGASLEQATTDEKKRAAEAYAEGMDAFRKKRYEPALAAFERSYATVRSPNSMLMIGRMLVELDRIGLAWDALRQAERDAEAAAGKEVKYRHTAAAARAELKDLEPLAGYVSVDVTHAAAGGHVVIEGRNKTFDELGEPVGVAPGKVRVVLVSSDGEQTAREVEVAAGARVEVELQEPVRPPPPAAASQPEPNDGAKAAVSTERADKRTLAYVAGGVGAAGLVVFGVFGALNAAQFSDLEDSCSGNVCPRALQDDAETGQTYQTIANLGLVVGVLGVGTGVTLFLLSRGEAETPVATTRLRLGPGTVSVSGSF